MSTIALFFKRPQPTEIIATIAGALSPILLDATLKESFKAEAEVTQHPIEDGADVSDHVILKPTSLTISGIVTETPFEGLPGLVKAAGASVGSLIGQALGPFGTAAGAVAGGIGGKSLAGAITGSTDRALSDYVTHFVAVRDARQPVDILTGLTRYTGYILSSFTCSRDQKTGGSITVDLEFKQRLLATSQVTQVAIPKVAGGLKASNKGNQSKESLPTDQNTRGSSLAKKLFGG